MSTRRQAKVTASTSRRQARSTEPEQVPEGTWPEAVRLGCCIEVWAEHGHDPDPETAAQRFGRVLAVLSSPDPDRTPPGPQVWSVDGSAWSPRRLRPVQRDAVDPVARFTAIGVTLTDVPRLRQEADELFTASLGGSLGRHYLRTREGG